MDLAHKPDKQPIGEPDGGFQTFEETREPKHELFRLTRGQRLRYGAAILSLGVATFFGPLDCGLVARFVRSFALGR